MDADLAGVCLQHQAPCPQDANPVGDAQHLLQLVTDEDDRASLAGKPTDHLEQVPRFLWRKDCRRLVEDQHIDIPRQDLKKLDALLQTDRQRSDPCLRRNRQAEGV